jgi:hypothetical protein
MLLWLVLTTRFKGTIMATDSIVGGLFGMTPESYQDTRQQLEQRQALQQAQLDPYEAVNYMAARAGQQLGRGIGGLLGGQDPQLQKISAIQSLGQQFDVTTPEGLMQAAGAIRNQYPDVAFGLSQKAQELGLARAKTQKETFSLSQETKLRDELSRLPPDATQEQILGVVTKYGSPDRVLAALQASSDRSAQREANLQMAKDRIDAQIQMAKDRGANAMQIAQMQLEGRQQMATIAQGMQQQSLDLRREAADEKKRALEQQKLGVVSSFDSAIDTLDTIAKHPGKKAAVGFGGAQLSMIPGTDAAGFAAQLETFKAQTFLPQVQALKGMGALSDAEGKKLTAAVGALSQSMKQSEFDAQVTKIKGDLEAARARANSSLKNAPNAPAPTTPVATKRWNPQTGQLEEIK